MYGLNRDQMKFSEMIMMDIMDRFDYGGLGYEDDEE